MGQAGLPKKPTSITEIIKMTPVLQRNLSVLAAAKFCTCSEVS